MGEGELAAEEGDSGGQIRGARLPGSLCHQGDGGKLGWGHLPASSLAEPEDGERREAAPAQLSCCPRSFHWSLPSRAKFETTQEWWALCPRASHCTTVLWFFHL